MLPRGSDPLADVAAGLFDAWRRILGRAVASSRTSGHAFARVMRFNPTDLPWIVSTRSLLFAGFAAVLCGIALDAAIGPAGSWREAAGVGVSTAAWALVRLLLLRLVSEDAGPVTRAWALSLLPWCIGVTPALRALVWVASAGVAFSALRSPGIDARKSARTVAIAWVAQAALVVAVSALRWVALLALG